MKNPMNAFLRPNPVEALARCIPVIWIIWENGGEVSATAKFNPDRRYKMPTDDRFFLLSVGDWEFWQRLVGEMVAIHRMKRNCCGWPEYACGQVAERE